MANKPTKPNFPLGLESQDQSIFQGGFLNNGTIEHGPDAVLTVPETVDASGIPSAVRYNAEDDQFEGFYNEGGWLPLGGGNGGRWEALPHASSSLLQAGRAYLVDNTDGVSTVLFPSPKRIGDSVTVCDLYGKFSTYPLTVDGNGKSIYGSADSMTISTDNVSATFTWTGEARGWVITSGVGLGQGRVYSREIYSQILSVETSSIILSTQPTIVDVYVDGKRLKESLYTLDGYEVKFDPALASGSDTQIIQYIPIQLGTGGGGSGGTVITWEYNGGAAIGGETQIVLDVVVDSVSEIYIRGQRQQIGRGFTFDAATSTITLADELETGDDVVVVINGDPTVYNQIDRTPWEVARANNVSNAEVILSTDKQTALDGKTVLYDVETQTSWGIPEGVPVGAKISNVSSGVLTYNPGGINIILVELVNQKNLRELWERSLADMGLDLVLGSFRSGANVELSSQAVWFEQEGKCYIWNGSLPKNIPPYSTPVNSGGISPTAWSIVGNNNTGSYLNYVSIVSYSHLVVNGDWIPALVAADTKARDLGWWVDGQGLTYTLGSTATLRCARFRNMKLVPKSGYNGAAPIFVVDLSTGICVHDSVDASNFKLTGPKILQSSYVGETTAIFKGICRYNNNGNLIRTTLTSDVNTSTAFVIPVADASSFKAEDPVHIGDGRYKILSISGNSITLYNDGVGATLFDSGTRYQHYAGQYVTLNQGYDNNGIRVGNSTQGWTIYVEGVLEANNNGWTGFYHDSGSYSGYHSISNIRASGNGYIGIGLGYVNKGSIHDCVTENNGNNGLDIFESKQTYLVHSNVSIGNGVDNLFVGGNGETAAIYDNTCINAQRIGILVFGRTTALYAVELSNNKCLGNKYRSIGVTGGRYVKIIGGNVGGANNWSIYIEGRSGLNNPDKVTIKNVDMYQSVLGDVGGNLRNNTSFAAGTIDLIDNNTFSRMPTTSVTNTNYYGCKFYPECYIAGTSDFSATAGATISVALSIRRPHNSSVIDAAAVLPVTMTISSTSDGTDQSSVTSAVKTLSNVTELLNTATTRGKIIAIPDSGSVSYNFTLNAAGTRYILVESGGFRKLLTLVWS